MEPELWDIKDKLPVVMPVPNGRSEAALQLAIRNMPYRDRVRFLRALGTVSAVERIVSYGIKMGFTQP